MALFEKPEVTLEEPVVEQEKTDEQLPEYLLTDCEIVGYTDEESQRGYYQWALDGIPISDGTVLYDQGCGRADLHQFILENLAYGNVEYIGVDVNPLMGMIAKKLDRKIRIQSWLDIEVECDVAVNIFGFLQHGLADISDGNKLEYMRQTIEHTMKSIRDRYVLVFLTNNAGVEAYTEYPIGDVLGILGEGYNYSVDKTLSNPIVKLTLYK